MASAISLLSGGLDSTVALGLALEDGPVLRALTVDYGQRAALRECERSAALAEQFGVPHEVVELPFFRRLPAGALLDPTASLPEPDDDALEAGGFCLEESAAAVWVPNRNGVLVEIAAAYAEALGAQRVIVGFNREEGETFPDNRADYLEALNRALRFSTRGRVTVDSPTADLDKAGIVREGQRIGVPWATVWPCYGAGPDLCRRCESCRRFLRAIREVGIEPGPPWE